MVRSTRGEGRDDMRVGWRDVRAVWYELLEVVVVVDGDGERDGIDLAGWRLYTLTVYQVQRKSG